MDLSLSEDQIRDIVMHYAELRASHGEAFLAPRLVEPTGEFFPDEFTLDPEGIGRVLRRVLEHSPVSSEVDVSLGFIQPDGEVSGGGGCGGGACGTGGLKDIARGGAVETEDGYAALVHVQDVGDPTILTTALSRAVGRIVMFEAGEAVPPSDEGRASELTALASGFGLLLLNGACVYKKGCGGMKRHQATFLEVEQLAFGLALFVRVTEAAPRNVRRHLEVTQKEAFDAALSWVDAHPALVQALRERPETLRDGVFPTEEKRGFFSRLFSKRSESELAFAPALGAKPRERSPEELRRLAEAKALVDSALTDP
jgi:hypothetical protein